MINALPIICPVCSRKLTYKLLGERHELRCAEYYCYQASFENNWKLIDLSYFINGDKRSPMVAINDKLMLTISNEPGDNSCRAPLKELNHLDFSKISELVKIMMVFR